MTHRLLVPVDFSTIAANAVQYALELAPKFNTGVALLHIVSDEEYIPENEVKMAQFLKGFKGTDVSIKTFVHKGNLFDDIAKAAEFLEVYMVVMGTSGLKGLQYLFGSKALRIVTSATAPFLITQEEPPKAEINTMLVPIDLAKEDKQILSLAVQASILFKSKIHLFVARHEDEFSRNKTFRNENFAHKYLDGHNIHYTTVHAEGKKDFANELLDYADLISADLIAMVNHKEEGFLNLLGANFDQTVITNQSGTPVLVMNAQQHNKLTDIFNVFE